MAPQKSKNPGRTARFYAANPEAYKKKLAAQKKINARPKQVAYRVKLKAARKKMGIAGKGGPDLSHTNKGTLVKEDPKKNRSRNGHGNNGRLKIR
jgi:hypothetical protein